MQTSIYQFTANINKIKVLLVINWTNEFRLRNALFEYVGDVKQAVKSLYAETLSDKREL